MSMIYCHACSRYVDTDHEVHDECKACSGGQEATAQTQDKGLDRFDIPATVQHVIKVALEQNVIDAMDVYSMGVVHGKDWEALVNDITESAFSWIHTNQEKHSAVAKAAEGFWETRVAP